MPYRFDFHCHVTEGSKDSKVPIEKYIEILKNKGFYGMVTTDHDSYKGYEAYITKAKERAFTVLKGIEYDTFDAGHFIVVMPDSFDTSYLAHKGLRVSKLVKYVHENGGILGPAHSFSEPFLSIFKTHPFHKSHPIIKDFDFIEGFNACEYEKDNQAACDIANKYNLPLTGGSDAHWEGCVGEGYTDFFEEIHTNNELIDYIKSKKKTEIGGKRFYGTTRDKLGRFNKILVYLFFPYNRLTSLLRQHTAKKLDH